MNTQYKVRPTFLGLLWQVIMIADGYSRGTMSYHFSKGSAVKMVEFYEKNC